MITTHGLIFEKVTVSSLWAIFMYIGCSRIGVVVLPAESLRHQTSKNVYFLRAKYFILSLPLDMVVTLGLIKPQSTWGERLLRICYPLLTAVMSQQTNWTKPFGISSTVINFSIFQSCGEIPKSDSWRNDARSLCGKFIIGIPYRYGGYGAIAYHHISDTYIALFSHFIPCGVWKAIYIIDGLLKNKSDIQPDTVHADTQGQSTPVFALSHLLGINLMPRIRNWKDLTFFRPDKDKVYEHIDSLFNDTIDWDIIEMHWKDLLQVVLSIKAGKINCIRHFRYLAGWYALYFFWSTFLICNCGSK